MRHQTCRAGGWRSFIQNNCRSVEYRNADIELRSSVLSSPRRCRAGFKIAAVSFFDANTCPRSPRHITHLLCVRHRLAGAVQRRPERPSCSQCDEIILDQHPRCQSPSRRGQPWQAHAGGGCVHYWIRHKRCICRVPPLKVRITP